jgi:hypothetical protein
MNIIMAIVATCQINAMAPNKEILNNIASYQKSCQVYLSKCILSKGKKIDQRSLLQCVAHSGLKKI